MHKKNIIIAIDGHSGCGKSTTAQGVAKKLGYIYVSTGSMYRAVTWYLLTHNIDRNQLDLLTDFLDTLDISYTAHADNMYSLVINGIEMTNELYLPDVVQHVSAVSAIQDIRHKLVQLQQSLGSHGGIVMDGRDIGSVVFPHAQLKIFMTASIHIRAQRRYEELHHKGISMTIEEIEKNLSDRDHDDSTRSHSPLVQVPDAIIIDTSDMMIDQQIDHVVSLAREKISSVAS